MVAAAAISAGGFDKKLYDALRKGTPLLIRGGGKAAEQAAEKIVQDAVAKYGAHGAEDLRSGARQEWGDWRVLGDGKVHPRARGEVAGAPHSGRIRSAELSVGRRRTNAVGHLERSGAQADYREAESGRDTTSQDDGQALAAAYEKAYANYPTWLAIMKPYFAVGK